ncbi:MAG TPA: type II toxin-antitoxin system HicA family toxin [Xanthomonadaceae bacterium]|nr:type II toxin-antitoxin system HicA family toxin [Xanthomonadaceae bacterium]
MKDDEALGFQFRSLLSFVNESRRFVANNPSRWMVLDCNARKPSSVQAREQAWSRNVPGKPGDDLAPGTLNSMLKQAGLK